MSLSTVSPGVHAPEEVNVIIEIPANSAPVKYEVDKVTGAIFVDRFMATPMFYPCNYGYVNETLAEDGDPVDVLVLTPYPVLSGAVLPARPVAVLRMEDEAGDDAKLLAVPPDRLCTEFAGIRGAKDVPEHLLKRIEHFFQHYKDLEPGKWVKLRGWGDAEEARQVILDSIQRHKDAQ
jgi:inorganic pyrophosphatase